ncbi:unnamed protein product [Candida parapsilosis]|uniref:Vezatin domain-containing protein n=1 Tax=Candida parapsilosis (strain CDC 317 / ATCC MYA-4646) TaxID=578454 RepID=G8BFX3_CANPC|nr:uncharacterized protein CPAR2_204000 [Candida parapsilosis]CCE42757.1 hypothetical protein CPAR2_204000 [Candida parapsilosis]
MNFDRFNPLSSNFIYKQNPTKEQQQQQQQQQQQHPHPHPHPHQDAKLNLNSEVSDWGIEEDLTPTSALGTTFSNYLSPTASSTTTIHTNPPSQIAPSLTNRQSSYSNYSAGGGALSHDDTFLPPHPSYIPHHSQPHSSSQSPFKRRGSLNSNSSSQFHQYHQTLNHHPLHRSHSQASQLNLLQYCQYSGNVIYPNTETLSRFIAKYMSMENKLGEFWEKFKYNLIISNLLEDSMILSKNESSLQLLKTNPISTPSNFLKFTINDDGTRLLVLNTFYKVKFSCRYSTFTSILLVINLIIYLLKQQQFAYLGRHHMKHESQFTLFKFIIVVSSKLIKVRKFKTIVETNKILNLLNDFLKFNYIVNKNLILSMVKLKGKKLDLVQGNANSSHLLNSLSFLNLTLRSLVVKLLPHINGDLFQQYCTINSINTGILTQEFDNEDQDDLDEVIFNINKFNQLRKLFICQLITINENASSNFFTLNLMDQFQVDEVESNLSVFAKMKLVRKVLTDHNDSVKTINNMFNKVEIVSQPQKQTQPIDENIAPDLHSTLFQFTSRVNKFAHNLNYFNKYNQSLSLDNAEEQYEKLAIFQQFNDELNQLKTLHKQAFVELNQEINPDYTVANSPKSTVSSSPRLNQAASFNLKSFQNTSLKKRFSLPPNVATSNPTPPGTTNGNTTIDSPAKWTPERSSTTSSKPKKYKRLSTGLQLGLLTVFEENGGQTSIASSNGFTNGNRNSSSSSTSASASASASAQAQAPVAASPTAAVSSGLLPPPKVSYDDNYINILPTNQFESYNKSTLDQLISSKAKNNRYSLNNNNRNSTNINRFSLNSVKSNVSGISDLISTQMTSYNGDDAEAGAGTSTQAQIQGDIDGKMDFDIDESPNESRYDQLNDNNNVSVIDDDSNPGRMTQEELKLKLEASFTKIYNLETENEQLMKENTSKRNNRATKIINDDIALSDITNDHHPSASFLKELEFKLNPK